MKRPDLSIHYIARVIEGNIKSSNSSNRTARPPLASHLVVNLFMQISQIFLACTLNKHLILPTNDCQVIENFVAKAISGLTIDFSNLSAKSCIIYCHKIMAKLKTMAIIGNSTIVTPYSRLNYSFDEFPFEPHFFKYRVDNLKSMMLKLISTVAKLEISVAIECVPIDKEIVRIALEDFTTSFKESIHAVEPNENIPFVLLTAVANHFEAVRTISPSLALGSFSYNIYALFADLYQLDILYPELDIAKSLQVSGAKTRQVRTGLLQAARILLLSYLNTCVNCLDDYSSSEIFFQKAINANRHTIPCPHRFLLKTEMN